MNSLKNKFTLEDLIAQDELREKIFQFLHTSICQIFCTFDKLKNISPLIYQHCKIILIWRMNQKMMKSSYKKVGFSMHICVLMLRQSYDILNVILHIQQFVYHHFKLIKLCLVSTTKLSSS